MLDQDLGETIGEVGRVGVAPIHEGGALGAPQDDGAGAPFPQCGRQCFSHLDDPILSLGLGSRVEQYGGLQEGELP